MLQKKGPPGEPPFLSIWQLSGTPSELQSVASPKKISHSLRKPFPSQSLLVPELMSQMSGIPFPLQSTAAPGLTLSDTPHPHMPGDVLAGSLGQPSSQPTDPSLSGSPLQVSKSPRNDPLNAKQSAASELSTHAVAKQQAPICGQPSVRTGTLAAVSAQRSQVSMTPSPSVSV